MPTGNDAVRKVVNGRAQKNKVKVDTSNGDQIRHSELENEPPKGTVQLPAPPWNLAWLTNAWAGRAGRASCGSGVADRRRGGRTASTPGGRGQCTCAGTISCSRMAAIATSRSPATAMGVPSAAWMAKP